MDDLAGGIELRASPISTNSIVAGDCGFSISALPVHLSVEDYW